MGVAGSIARLPCWRCMVCRQSIEHRAPGSNKPTWEVPSLVGGSRTLGVSCGCKPSAPRPCSAWLSGTVPYFPTTDRNNFRAGEHAGRFRPVPVLCHHRKTVCCQALVEGRDAHGAQGNLRGPCFSCLTDLAQRGGRDQSSCGDRTVRRPTHRSIAPSGPEMTARAWSRWSCRRFCPADFSCQRPGCLRP